MHKSNKNAKSCTSVMPKNFEIPIEDRSSSLKRINLPKIERKSPQKTTPVKKNSRLGKAQLIFQADPVTSEFLKKHMSQPSLRLTQIGNQAINYKKIDEIYLNYLKYKNRFK